METELFTLTNITICSDGYSVLVIGRKDNMHLKAETGHKIIANFVFSCHKIERE